MIKAIAIDDEPPALEILENYCQRSGQVALVKVFTSTAKALDYLANFPVDVVLLDIQMPSMNGIEFSKRIQDNTMVIFTTSFTEYAVESYNQNAVDYLLKPYSFDRFQQAISKAVVMQQYNIQQKHHPFLVLRQDYSLVRIPLSDILYIEGFDNYLKVHTINQMPLLSRITMKAIHEKLPDREFIRVHRSFIVALDKIESVRNKVISVGKAEIPLGPSHEKGFYSRFNAVKNA
jgi:DNA-binding LytR/AlgR family response regulator